MSAADFLTGTQYLGQWQTRVGELLEGICRPTRVVLYVPSIDGLLTAGVSSTRGVRA